jgi:Uma2 family endonuclease
METLNLDLTKQYTFADYLTWTDDVSRELINGFIHFFAAPHNKHAYVITDFTGIIYNEWQKYEDLITVTAPVDVLFEKKIKDKNKIINVVQPDILICKKNQFKEGRCYGSPLFIAEVLSKQYRKKDRVTKFELYQKNQVLEYWLIDPFSKTIEIYNYIDCKYSEGEVYLIDEEIEIKCLNNFKIKVSDIFKHI